MVAWLGFKRLLSYFRRGLVLGGWGMGDGDLVRGSSMLKSKLQFLQKIKKNVVKTTPAAK